MDTKKNRRDSQAKASEKTTGSHFSALANFRKAGLVILTALSIVVLISVIKSKTNVISNTETPIDDETVQTKYASKGNENAKEENKKMIHP